MFGKAPGWALAISLLAPLSLSAQATPDSTPVISHISLDRRNIFDDTELSWVTRLVNRLHVRTRAPVIRREFLFAVGEPYDSAKVAETKRNLMSGLRVFRDVSIDTVRNDSGVTVAVVTRDGWSTRPDFRFRSTGGSIAYTLAMIEDNLLGTATQAELLYRDEPDRTTTILGFSRRRLIAGKIGASFTYANRSDGDLFAGTVRQPFFSLSSRNGAALSFDTRRERVLQFRDGLGVATDTLQRRFVLVRADVARAFRASTAGYIRVGTVAQVRRDDFAGQSVFDVQGLPRSVSGAAGLFVEARRADFLEARGFESFGRPEHVDLSNVVRVSLLLAPKALGYARNGIAPGLAAQTAIRFGGGFAFAALVASGLFTAAGLDSGQVTLGATAVFLPSARHHVVLHAEAGALSRPAPGQEFDLGLGIGPRAFREHAFTGDRQAFGTVEYRYTVAQDFLKVTGIGVAAFADYGGAWWHGEKRRSGWDAGVGLRLGPSRAPDQEANRIDIARRFATDRDPGGWVLVVGKGFTFSTSSRASR